MTLCISVLSVVVSLILILSPCSLSLFGESNKGLSTFFLFKQPALTFYAEVIQQIVSFCRSSVDQQFPGFNILSVT